MKRIRALRAQIGSNFLTVAAQADAVPLEFGMRRAEAMANRALIKSWQPQLQAVYLEQVALMQHRVFGAEERLPAPVQAAQHRFNEACASLLNQMADHVGGNAGRSWKDLDSPLWDLSRATVEISSDHASFAAARGVETLSRRIRNQLTDLSQEIARSRVR